MNTYTLIQEFLSVNRFAMIGVSRNSKDFSRSLFNEFLTHGYDVVPVNPFVAEIESKRCYTRVAEIEPRVTGALIMTPPSGTETLIQDCANAGISLVWLYGISGMKHVNPDAVRSCRELGIRVIPGYCPFMFMRASSWLHRAHGAVWKLVGLYPK